MIRPILHAPNPILSAQARFVRLDEFGPKLAEFVDDMVETMYAAPGVGLAAPQIGDDRRIIVLDSGEHGDAPPRSRLRCMVNPEILHAGGAVTWNESCLSVPFLNVAVDRSRVLTVRWLSPWGNPNEETFSEFEAVIVQHEIDHLNGKVLFDRLGSFARQRYLQNREKLTKRVARRQQCP